MRILIRAAAPLIMLAVGTAMLSAPTATAFSDKSSPSAPTPGPSDAPDYGTLTIIRELAHDLGEVTKAEVAAAKQAARNPSRVRSERIRTILTTPVREVTVITGPGIATETVRIDRNDRRRYSSGGWQYSDWNRWQCMWVEAWQYGESDIFELRLWEARTKIFRACVDNSTGRVTSEEDDLIRTALAHDMLWRTCGWSSTYRDFASVSANRHYRYEVGGIASFGYTGLGPVQPSCHKHAVVYLRVEGYAGGWMRYAWNLT